MPTIGRPNTLQDNKFSNITMRQQQAPVDKAEYLNKISGRKNESIFVDKDKHNKMGKNEFLKLLTHQLTNQDPLNPVDQQKFSAELAQFAQLEQLANMNTTLEAQGKNAPTENKFYAASFLGKQVTTAGTTIDYAGDGSSATLPFFLPKDASKVMIRLFDSKNQLIGQIERDNMNRGNQNLRWDGISLDGTVAVKDTYTVSVRAWDKDFNEFNGETKSTGVVTDVTFENGETVFKLDGKKSVFLRDVESFKLLEDNKVKKPDVKQVTAAYKQ